MKWFTSIVLASAVFAFEVFGGEVEQEELKVDGGLNRVVSYSFYGVRYEKESRTMTFVCHSGRKYEYYEVSMKAFVSFMLVEDKDLYFDEYIRGHYAYRRLPLYSGSCPYMRSLRR
ncbi:MAG: KTSC domain-containing protein [Verrucomicrobiota bacterium]